MSSSISGRQINKSIHVWSLGNRFLFVCFPFSGAWFKFAEQIAGVFVLQGSAPSLRISRTLSPQCTAGDFLLLWSKILEPGQHLSHASKQSRFQSTKNYALIKKTTGWSLKLPENICISCLYSHCVDGNFSKEINLFIYFKDRHRGHFVAFRKFPESLQRQPHAECIPGVQL